MPYLYYILLSLLLLSACQGEKKSKGNQNQITVDSAQSRKTTGPKYVKSVQFVYPMKFDTCRFNEELKIVYANNKHYKIDSAHLFFNQKQIATLDSATREFVFKIPKEKCGTNTLKVIAFHPNNKCGVATQSFIVKPDKAPQPLQYQLVKTYSHISEESQKLFAPERETVGLCPRCGKPVYEGRKNFYCSDRSCQFVLWKDDRFWASRKKELTKKMAGDLLKKGRTSVKGMWSEKKGSTYDAVVVLDDTGEKYVRFKLEFPKRKEGVNGKK